MYCVHYTCTKQLTCNKDTFDTNGRPHVCSQLLAALKAPTSATPYATIRQHTPAYVRAVRGG